MTELGKPLSNVEFIAYWCLCKNGCVINMQPY